MMVETHDEVTRYQQMTPKSRERWLEATDYLPGGDSRHSIFWDPYPIFVASASGCHVIDADGTDRLDFINTMTTMILGHAPKAGHGRGETATRRWRSLQRPQLPPSQLGQAALRADTQL